MTAVLGADQVPAERPAAEGGPDAVPPAPTAPQPPVSRFPPRPVVAHWPATGADRAQVLVLAASASSPLAASPICHARLRGLCLLLDWLGDQPGQSWQERWLASGADDAGEVWAERPAAWLQGLAGPSWLRAGPWAFSQLRGGVAVLGPYDLTVT